MRCMISAMRGLLRCAAAPSTLSAAVRKIFQTFFRKWPHDRSPKWLPGEGRLLHHWEGQAVSAVCPSCYIRRSQWRQSTYASIIFRMDWAISGIRFPPATLRMDAPALILAVMLVSRFVTATITGMSTARVPLLNSSQK